MNKIKYVFALSLVLALVIATNVMDNTSFKIVKDSIENIYEDRLMAYDLIYKMSNELAKKKLQLSEQDSVQVASVISSAEATISDLMAKYEMTKLTRKESKYFETLKEQFEGLKKYNTANISNSDLEQIRGYRQQLVAFSETLDELAQIQVEEGKRQLNNSNRAIKSSDILARMEIIAIIIIGIIIQAIILYKPKED